MKTSTKISYLKEHYEADLHSPFHRGEQIIQEALGIRDKMERFGQKVIRNYLPEQHRHFYEALPFLMLGHIDSNGWPWASMLVGDEDGGSKKFISSSNEYCLDVLARPLKGDPFWWDFSKNEFYRDQYDRSYSGVGVLGIEFHSRRRNRLSANLVPAASGLRLDVVQTFGNCPKYIQSRHLKHKQTSFQEDPSVFDSCFPEDVERIISKADTFFVSSYSLSSASEGSGVKGSNSQASKCYGVDVSHRGGQSGFVKVDNGKSLVIPDYSGNNHFNTLGNLLENPKAGLTFVDFEYGHVVLLTGKVTIEWDSKEVDNFKGAQRLWRFELAHGVFLANNLPFSFEFDT